MKDFEIIEIGDRMILVKGLGRMFYQEGIPIGIIADELIKRGVEICWYHVIDELSKHGWAWERIFLKLRDEILDGTGYDEERAEHFFYSGYETQRQLIFQYLYGNDLELAKKHLAIRLNAFYGKQQKRQQSKKNPDNNL